MRILATSADKPYAAPGDTVKLNVLAVDGRPTQSTPMSVYWLPSACINPSGDAYYACFPAFAKAFRPGVDLGTTLTAGSNFTFQMPADAIASRAPGSPSSPGSPGSPPPAGSGDAAYGLAVVFTLACAGHLEYVPPPAGGALDAVPFGCFDGAGVRLGADDFVFAYSLVYSFADRTNENPVIQDVTFGGTKIDGTAGITIDHCTKAKIADCATTPLDVDVAPSSQELDPGNLDANGSVLREELYVDYYVTAGKVETDTMVLFDPRTGRISDTGDKFYAPQTAGEYRFWAVIHDNRGGVAWQEFPLHAH